MTDINRMLQENGVEIKSYLEEKYIDPIGGYDSPAQCMNFRVVIEPEDGLYSVFDCGERGAKYKRHERVGWEEAVVFGIQIYRSMKDELIDYKISDQVCHYAEEGDIEKAMSYFSEEERGRIVFGRKKEGKLSLLREGTVYTVNFGERRIVEKDSPGSAYAVLYNYSKRYGGAISFVRQNREYIRAVGIDERELVERYLLHR